MNSTRCGFGTNGLPYRSRHVPLNRGLRMARILPFFALEQMFRDVPTRGICFGRALA